MKIFCSIFIICLFSIFSVSAQITYSNPYYCLVLNSNIGSIQAIEKDGYNLISTVEQEPLFNIRFRDPLSGGKIYEYNALQANVVEVEKQRDNIKLFFSGFPNKDISVIVSLQMNDTSPFIAWNISVNNNTEYSLDHIDFPNLIVQNDLVGNGGTGRIFWPGNEGCLIEDIEIRERGGLKYRPIEWPYMGCGGIYPTATQMQYMAYYNANGGVYLAAHDEHCNPKGIEFYRICEDKIKLEFRLFTGGSREKTYTMPYDMILGVFEGDWYDASTIYRNWREMSSMKMPPKIEDNRNLPKWYFESPVIVSYPIRGKKDLGDMTPNKMYPYTNGLKVLDKLQNDIDNKIMALLMHWEGSAPWAPPYVWPPFGGENIYQQFVDSMHRRGNLVGLYASGIGYTLQSNTDTTYNMSNEFRQQNLEDIMKVAPNGSLGQNGTCSGPNAQRIGYDMCPTNSFVKKVVLNQISKIASSGTDYVQYFDQNHGGNCYMCYGINHGHGYGPGLWQVTAMQDLYDSIDSLLGKQSHKILIGCESAAAESFLPYLLFNDNRYNLNLNIGKPVPAYAFVYHEYVNNFMGNQVGTSWTVKLDKNPYNYLQRIAYSFCAGDLMTIVIDDVGNIITSWGASWNEEKPNQLDVKKLIRNLSDWRKGFAKDFLIKGKMIKPIDATGMKNIPMITTTNKTINFDSVFMSNWQLASGLKAQIFVNYLPYEQTIKLDIDNLQHVQFYSSPYTQGKSIDSTDNPTIKIPPLNAVMISYF